MEVWFYPGTTAERPTHAERKSKRIYTRAPPKRAGRAFALLTKTYHRSRVIGNLEVVLIVVSSAKCALDPSEEADTKYIGWLPSSCASAAAPI
jgi:hypothetical protein